MKPLNRPMFKMGGPIKEGLMVGIREPKKKGGMLLVGEHPEEFKASDGREKHVAPIVYGVGMGLARLAPLARNIYQGFRAARYIDPKAVTMGQKIRSAILPTTRFRNMEAGTGFRLGAAIKQNPLLAFTAASSVPQAATGTYKGAIEGVKKIPDLAKGYVDLVLPGEQFRKKPGSEIEKEGGPPGGGNPDMFLSPKGDKPPPGVTLTDKEKRNQQIQKYRDIMDIKGMNKEAAYDSLIAASKAIGESGDFKGDIKSGRLINQIIQGASKAFDKPRATKDAIDTLILKGEIEKDIKASDPSSKIANELNLARIEKLNKELEGNSFAEAKAIMRKAGSKGQNEITDAAKSLEDVNYQGTLISKSDFKDVIETAKNTAKDQGGTLSEEEIIEGFATNFIAGKNAPDGEYVVGDAIISIRDGQVVPGSVRR